MFNNIDWLDDLAVYIFILPSIVGLLHNSLKYAERRRWRLVVICVALAIFAAGNAVIRVGTDGGTKTIDQTTVLVQSVGSDFGFFLRSAFLFVAMFLAFWLRPVKLALRRFINQAKTEVIRNEFRR